MHSCTTQHSSWMHTFPSSRLLSQQLHAIALQILPSLTVQRCYTCSSSPAHSPSLSLPPSSESSSTIPSSCLAHWNSQSVCVAPLSDRQADSWYGCKLCSLSAASLAATTPCPPPAGTALLPSVSSHQTPLCWAGRAARVLVRPPPLPPAHHCALLLLSPSCALDGRAVLLFWPLALDGRALLLFWPLALDGRALLGRLVGCALPGLLLEPPTAAVNPLPLAAASHLAQPPAATPAAVCGDGVSADRGAFCIVAADGANTAAPPLCTVWVSLCGCGSSVGLYTAAAPPPSSMQVCAPSCTRPIMHTPGCCCCACSLCACSLCCACAPRSLCACQPVGACATTPGCAA